MTIVEFLTARYDEAEEIAANDLTPGPWSVRYECPEGDHHHDWDEVWIAGRGRSTVAGFNERYTSGPRDAAHVVHWQPAAVLADLASKRAILAWCSERDRIWVGTIGSDPNRPTKEDFAPGGLTNREGHVILSMLAAAYADHPDYRDEWRP